MNVRVGKILLFWDIYMRWSHNSCKTTSKGRDKNLSFPAQFFPLSKLTKSLQILSDFQKVEKFWFRNHFLKWNYFTHFDPKWPWPLAAFFHYYSIFQEFSKKMFFFWFFIIFWKTGKEIFLRTPPPLLPWNRRGTIILHD